MRDKLIIGTFLVLLGSLFILLGYSIDYGVGYGVTKLFPPKVPMTKLETYSEAIKTECSNLCEDNGGAEGLIWYTSTTDCDCRWGNETLVEHEE